MSFNHDREKPTPLDVTAGVSLWEARPRIAVEDDDDPEPLPAPPQAIVRYKLQPPVLGAKKELTRDLIKRIAMLIKRGNNRSVAAASLGVSRTQFAGWLKRGNEPDEPRTSLYSMLARTCDRAEAIDEQSRVDRLNTAAKAGNTDIDKFILERKYPGRWSQKVKIEVEMQLQQVLDRLEKALSPDVYEKVIRVFSGEDLEGETGEDQG